jgi:1,4-alpha-glucan branching enzyme
MGARLVAGGVTFRIWAPRAAEVYLNGTFGGVPHWDQTPDRLMAKDASGHWTGFAAGAADGDPYKFFVVGAGSRGFKRDPYARELTADPPFPSSNCMIRDPASYPWHDAGFRTPGLSDMIVYQLHVGTYAPHAPHAASTFLDVVAKIEHLAALGVNVIQPLPVDELETSISLGYNGSDYFSPDIPYVVRDPAALAEHLAIANRLLAQRGLPPMASADIESGPNQLKAMIDLCHVYGMAVVFDVVYNHAGGFSGDDEAIFFEDRAVARDNNDSLYFTDKGWAGGLSFALWNRDVRQFLIDSARYYLTELHVDGFRYDEISALVELNGESGWSFCRDITSTVRFLKPQAVQNAEFWPVNGTIVKPAAAGGGGFDVTQHDGLREALRDALAQAAHGGAAAVDLSRVAANLFPYACSAAWQAVTCIENHDIVKHGEKPRIPALADGSDPRSWYARSRTRAATALLLMAPGIPMLFMGQEFLEEKQWTDDPAGPGLIAWPAVGDTVKNDHLRFTRDAIAVRRAQLALRGENVRAFHVHDGNRVVAFHRWLEGAGRDVVVVVSLSESTYREYALGFPSAGRWLEVFNSDVYDGWVNPAVAGNGGSVDANGEAMHGFAASARIVIPANAVVVFARDRGDR